MNGNEVLTHATAWKKSDIRGLRLYHSIYEMFRINQSIDAGGGVMLAREVREEMGNDS